jgi:hypothetical protein
LATVCKKQRLLVETDSTKKNKGNFVISLGRAPVEATHERQSTLEIQRDGRGKCRLAKVRVFVDGAQVGVLCADQKETFSLPSGLHQVWLCGRLLKSEILYLSVAVGENIQLEWGVHKWNPHGVGLLALVVIAVQPVVQANLPMTAAAIAALGVVVLFALECRRLLTPGICLHLKPLAAREIPPAERTASSRPTRLTIRRLMAIVAVLALLLWMGIEERGMRMRGRYESLSKIYSDAAESYAQAESQARERGKFSIQPSL